MSKNKRTKKYVAPSRLCSTQIQSVATTMFLIAGDFFTVTQARAAEELYCVIDSYAVSDDETIEYEESARTVYARRAILMPRAVDKLKVTLTGLPVLFLRSDCSPVRVICKDDDPQYCSVRKNLVRTKLALARADEYFSVERDIAKNTKPAEQRAYSCHSCFNCAVLYGNGVCVAKRARAQKSSVQLVKSGRW